MSELAPEPAKDPWQAAYDEFKTRDKKMVKDFGDEIDTLLVFVRGPHRLFAIADRSHLTGWTLLGRPHCLRRRVVPFPAGGFVPDVRGSPPADLPSARELLPSRRARPCSVSCRTVGREDQCLLVREPAAQSCRRLVWYIPQAVDALVLEVDRCYAELGRRRPSPVSV
jgi:hypothetical protein